MSAGPALSAGRSLVTLLESTLLLSKGFLGSWHWRVRRAVRWLMLAFAVGTLDSASIEVSDGSGSCPGVSLHPSVLCCPQHLLLLIA